MKLYIRLEEFLQEVEPPSLVLVGDTLEYEVEGNLWHQGKGARHRYLVLWKGYSLHELPGSLNLILLMLQMSLRNICAVSQHGTRERR